MPLEFQGTTFNTIALLGCCYFNCKILVDSLLKTFDLKMEQDPYSFTLGEIHAPAREMGENLNYQQVTSIT